MDKIQMADIIPLLPLPYPPHGKSAYYVPCPHCDDPGIRSDKHLNINFSKNVFRCARCGWHGGIFDLYAFFANVPRDEAREDLIRKLKLDDADSKGKPAGKVLPTPSAPLVIKKSSLASIDIRHATYSALLSILSLAPDHKENLIGRGLSEQAIIENGYKTTPMIGGRMIAKHLVELGLQIEGVPGFYKDKAGEWTFIIQKRGILVPVRDSQGKTQGLQVRRDDASKGKFRWIASAEIDGSTCGCGAESWVHLAGPVRERILLIEGPMKADIVHHLTGQTVLAVPGVNALVHLEPFLHTLLELGVVHIMTAFDMDYLKNPYVQNGYCALVDLLGRLNLQYGTYLWDPNYNGLDDYIWKYCLGDALSA